MGPAILPDMLVLHYTGFADTESAIDYLAEAHGRVSCHYVVSETGEIVQMVPEQLRAWHAGQSDWEGKTDNNGRSIGIEIQIPGHDRGYPPFPDEQMRAVIALGLDIVTRHGIAPHRVVAHSDIAPHRKIDPGEKFDWAWCAREGLGLWVPPEPLEGAHDVIAEGDDLIAVQLALEAYGYRCPPSGVYDARTVFVIEAFQRHFRPAHIDGRADGSTRRTLERLLAAKFRSLHHPSG
ncbi:MAG: N-acetylmuramoyl-L-alanine amidase [Hyphomicrobiaceae bacterium]